MFEWWLAWKYLKGDRATRVVSVFTVVSFLGVTIGVAVLIVTLAIINGFDQDLRDKILGTKAHILVTIAVPDSTRNGVESVRQRILHVEGVVGAAPFVTGQGMLMSATRTEGVAVFGVDVTHHAEVTNLHRYVRAGSLEVLDRDPKSVALGVELADRLDVAVGDHVTLFIPTLTPTPMGLFSRAQPCVVGALIKTGMYEFDRTIAYLPLKTAQDVYAMKGAVSAYAVKVRDPDRAREIAAVMRTLDHHWWATDWTALNHNLFSALNLEKRVMTLVSSLILSVAVFNIFGTLTMLVLSKKREIGMLRAVGASRATVSKLFLYQGGIIGCAGTLMGLGFACGLLVLLDRSNFLTLPGDVYYLTRIPLSPNVGETLGVLVGAVALSVLAAWYPAWKASRLDPVEVIRYG